MAHLQSIQSEISARPAGAERARVGRAGACRCCAPPISQEVFRVRAYCRYVQRTPEWQGMARLGYHPMRKFTVVTRVNPVIASVAFNLSEAPEIACTSS